MVNQLAARVREVWGVEDPNRQLRRYGAEHFSSALKELQDIDPKRIDDPSRLFIKTVRNIAVHHYMDQGVNPSLLSKIPGGDQDEPPFVALPQLVPWHPLHGAAIDLNLARGGWDKIPVSLCQADPSGVLSKA